MLVILDMIAFEVQAICIGLLLTLAAGRISERW